MAIFTVQATCVRTLPDGARVGDQVPTFFLDSNVQGFVDPSSARQAARVALRVLDPLCARKALGMAFHIVVCDERGNCADLDTNDD